MLINICSYFPVNSLNVSPVQLVVFPVLLPVFCNPPFHTCVSQSDANVCLDKALVWEQPKAMLFAFCRRLLCFSVPDCLRTGRHTDTECTIFTFPYMLHCQRGEQFKRQRCYFNTGQTFRHQLRAECCTSSCESGKSSAMFLPVEAALLSVFKSAVIFHEAGSCVAATVVLSFCIFK